MMQKMKYNLYTIIDMGKHVRIIGILLLALFFCPAMARKKIAFAEGVDEQKEIKLSEVASGVKYIPLETTAESLLDKDILNVTFAGDYLFVCDFVNLFQFTPEGKFIRKIGKAGEGPGEYAKSILAVTYDEDAKQIFISDFRDLIARVCAVSGFLIFCASSTTTIPHVFFFISSTSIRIIAYVVRITSHFKSSFLSIP